MRGERQRKDAVGGREHLPSKSPGGARAMRNGAKVVRAGDVLDEEVDWPLLLFSLLHM